MRLLERARADELVHLDVAGLADAKGAVGGLVLDRRVPPAVEVEDVVGGGKVQSRAARLEREDEDRRAVRGLEPLDHRVAGLLRDTAVQEEHLAAEGLLQVALEDLAHLGELGEHQGPLAHGEHLLEHLGQPRELAGAAGDRRVVAQQLRRMVADLLELQEHGQHQARRWMPSALASFSSRSASTAP